MNCYRHPDRVAGVRCQRCERYICPNCMVQASVGFHCPECVRNNTTKVHTLQSLQQSKAAIVTKIIIAINVIVYGLDVILAGGVSDSGGWLTSHGILYGAGNIGGTAQYVNNTWVIIEQFPKTGVAAGEYWRLVTSGFLHGSILHLLFNMFVLWRIGSILEADIGKARFFYVYITALFAGSCGVLLLDPKAPTLGASGAVFGVMGAAFLWQRLLNKGFQDSGLGALIVINIVFTFAFPGISIGGHVGGLIGGFLVGALLLFVEKRPGRQIYDVVISICLSLLFVGLGIWAASQWANPVFG